ncbi:MAG: polynucleotide adenylyltransferase PcnB, partial [Acidobacteriota bacterium]|nr:polynucleotide adenylyltransferase PcnB [Acidobacteriota bacterium]
MTEQDLADEQSPRVLARSSHPISRDDMPSNVVKVLYRLNKAGFKAYLVGGSVRDLMLGREPKDFDIGTDAKPAEIRRLFRNSRIIGRRFRLAHIYFQDGIIEAATFRRTPEEDEQESAPDELLITSDNTFGTPRQDAFRRDFTINALFYNIDDFSVLDYVGGIRDLEDRIVRCIGDPGIRFQEDPVRMMRACEFAARLGFTIEPRTRDGVVEWADELSKAAPARITEELIQLLRCGHAGSAIQWMLDLGLVDVLLPEVLDMVSAEAQGLGDLGALLPVIDTRMAEGEEISDSALVAAVLLPTVLLARGRKEAKLRRPLSRKEVVTVVQRATRDFLQRFSLAKAKAQGMLEALIGFQRLCEPGWTPARRRRYAGDTSFPDALSLFGLMVEATGQGREELEEWQEAGRLAAAERAKSKPPRRRGRGGGGG